jgi:hypothetical protein
MSGLRYEPDAILVVLTATSEHNTEVIRAASIAADGHPLVYLYLGIPVRRDVRQLEFNDPYLFDQQAQQVLSLAATAARHQRVTAEYVYRQSGSSSVLDAWGIVHPKEIIADAETAKMISATVAPDYVRYQIVDGVRIAHYVKRYIAGLDMPMPPAGGSDTQVNGRERVRPPETEAAGRVSRRQLTAAWMGMLRKLDFLHPDTVSGNGGPPETKHPRQNSDLAGYVPITKPTDSKDGPAVPKAPEAEEQRGKDQPE